MELDIQQIKSLVLPQRSASASINQGVAASPREGNAVNGFEDLGTAPSTLKMECSNKLGFQKFRTLPPLINECISKLFLLGQDSATSHQ
jgi:hypothetical protein